MKENSSTEFLCITCLYLILLFSILFICKNRNVSSGNLEREDRKAFAKVSNRLLGTSVFFGAAGIGGSFFFLRSAAMPRYVRFACHAGLYKWKIFLKHKKLIFINS